MPRGFAAVCLTIFFLVVLGVGAVFLIVLNKTKVNVVTSKVGPASAVTSLPTPTPVPSWKTYTNSKYRFELTYPKEGMILKETGFEAGECGGAIKAGGVQTGRIISRFVSETIQVDDFFEILVLNWPKSVEEYILAIGAGDQYNLKLIEGSLAEEAVEVVGLKKGAEYAVGYPPLAYISHIYKKGGKLFLIKNLLHPQNLGGCVHPSLLDPVSHSHLKVKSSDWDLGKSWKFLPPGG